MANRANTLLLLATGLGIAVVIAGLAGLRAAPDRALFDLRRSTRLTGPHGTSGFAEALARLGTTVERVEQPLFRLAAIVAPEPGTWLAVIEPSVRLRDPELRAVTRWIEHGGAAFIAGETGLEKCFNWSIRDVVPTFGDDPRRDRRLDTPVADVPPATALLHPTSDRDFELPLFGAPVACDAPPPEAVAVLLRTRGGDTVAVRLRFPGGGMLLALADAEYLANQRLKETDAGLVVLPLLLRESPRRVLVDEFHQGFGPHGSIFGATWSWLRRSPLGWAMLQLVFVALLALAAMAVRFGPALSPLIRTRRSQLEHVDALAVGLQRADGREATIGLMIDGLRRRLGRSVAARARSEPVARWLESLSATTRTETTSAAVAKLKHTLTTPGDDQVLAAAHAVEDLWEALQPGTTYQRS